jgi:hypothetical protein
MLMETTGIDKQTKLCSIKPLYWKPNQRSGKIYSHFPRVKKDGILVKVERWQFSPPSNELVNLYEERKKNFVMGTIGNAEKVMETKKEVKNKELPTWLEATAFYLLDIKLMSTKEVSKILRINIPNTARLRNQAIRKGINYQNIQNYAYLLKNVENLIANHEIVPLSN